MSEELTLLKCGMCYANKQGDIKERKLICPEHGDLKARGGRKPVDRQAAAEIRSEKGQKKGLKRTPLNPTSEKEDLSNAYLQGVKDSIITAMLTGGATAWCQKCEVDQTGATTLEKARSSLDLHHHDVKQSEGPRYNHKTKNPGRDNPEGLLLVCRNCHKELEKQQREGVKDDGGATGGEPADDAGAEDESVGASGE